MLSDAVRARAGGRGVWVDDSELGPAGPAPVYWPSAATVSRETERRPDCSAGDGPAARTGSLTHGRSSPSVQTLGRGPGRLAARMTVPGPDSECVPMRVQGNLHTCKTARCFRAAERLIKQTRTICTPKPAAPDRSGRQKRGRVAAGTGDRTEHCFRYRHQGAS